MRAIAQAILVVAASGLQLSPVTSAQSLASPELVPGILQAGRPGLVVLGIDLPYSGYRTDSGSRPTLEWSIGSVGGRLQFKAQRATSRGAGGACPPLLNCEVPAGIQRTSTTLEVPALVAGTHAVDIFEVDNTGTTADLATSMTFAPANNPGGNPWTNYSDHWWNPAEPGSGMMVWHDVSSGSFFVAYFGYGLDGKSYWFSLQGGAWQRVLRGQSIGFRYSGTLFESNGMGYNPAPPYLAPSAKAIGTGSIEFTDAGNGTFSYDITGVAARTMPIARFNP